MGRTGRKREGRIVMLVSEGKEEQIYNSCQMNKKSIHKVIQSTRKSLQYYQSSPRMVPRGLNPVCHRISITVPQYYAQHKAKLTSSKPAAQSLVIKSGVAGKYFLLMFVLYYCTSLIVSVFDIRKLFNCDVAVMNL